MEFYLRLVTLRLQVDLDIKLYTIQLLVKLVSISEQNQIKAGTHGELPTTSDITH